ncbi:ChbG/HpnK family deacetylase [Paenibacillus chitinolyticus]|uniref:ChbG/HpnK family deacetylase n=1 Tax=Paenibacillus chitinolyticus TaxID=79263 RepID=UPI00352128BC
MWAEALIRSGSRELSVGDNHKYRILIEPPLQHVQQGVTELIFHPSFETEELKEITDTWPVRQKEYEVFRDPDIRHILHKRILS